MSGTMRPVLPFTQEPQTDPSAPFRERIALRCVEHDAAHPGAVNLEARLTYRYHGSLAGVATNHRGIHSERRWRETLVGERHFHLADICRLATTPTRWAKDATFAALSELAYAIGFRLEPLDPKDIEAHEALANGIEASGEFFSDLSRALKNDGRVDATEADNAIPKLDALDRASAAARALLVKAKGRR